MSLRLLHIIDSLDPAHGGPSTVCASLAAAQASLGCQVRIVSYDTKGQERQIEAMLRDIPGSDFVDVVLVPRPKRGVQAALAVEARRRLPAAMADADFVILHGVWDRILLAGATAARRADKPYAVIPHGMLRSWSLSQKRWKKRLSLLLATRKMLNAAAYLHALNAEEAAAFAALGLCAPAEVIPNGVFLEQVDPLPPAGTFHAGRPELKGRPYVLFLGRVHFTKGLEFLADAFGIVARQHAKPVLVVAGPDGGRRDSFAREIAQTSIADRVFLVGPLYGRDKFAAYRDAACYALSSRTEGFSVAILEALASRCPVVISEHCHFPEVAVAGAGVITPLDPSKIAAGIAKYLDPAARAAGATAGRALVERDYTWSSIARKSIDACTKHGPARGHRPATSAATP